MANVIFDPDFEAHYRTVLSSRYCQREKEALDTLFEWFKETDGIKLAVIADQPFASYRRPIFSVWDETPLGTLYYFANVNADLIRIIDFQLFRITSG